MGRSTRKRPRGRCRWGQSAECGWDLPSKALGIQPLPAGCRVFPGPEPECPSLPQSCPHSVLLQILACTSATAFPFFMAHLTSEVALSPGFMARLKNSEPSGLFLSSPQMHIQSPDPNKSPFYRFSLPFLLCLCCPLLQALIHSRLSQTHNRSILPPLQSFIKSFGTSVFEELCMVSIRVNTPMAMH